MFKRNNITVVLLLGLAAGHGAVRTVGGPNPAALQTAPSHWAWQQEFDDLCARTQDAMAYSVEELAVLIKSATLCCRTSKRSTIRRKRSTGNDFECAEAFMLTCLIRKRTIRKRTIRNKTKRTRSSKRALLLVPICAIVLLVGTSLAQIYLPEAPPPQASDYGKVILDTYSAAPAGPGAVVFDHWLHRSRFTCRLCHVDIGFAMKAKATEIRAASNRQGFHCGACHDGKRVINGKTVFASCSDDVTSKQCARCHSLGRPVSVNTNIKNSPQSFRKPGMALIGKPPRMPASFIPSIFLTASRSNEKR